MNTLITGASSGIGEAIALACAARGDTLFLCGRNRDRLESVAEACRARMTTRDAKSFVRTAVLDVTDRAGMAAWIAACEAEAPLDRIFANAGVSTGAETNEHARRTFEINVGGTLNTVFPAIEIFRSRRPRDGEKAKRLQVIITASIAGYGPLKACPSYSASKACLKTWGLALRGQLAPEGIDVSVICPGFIRSRMTAGNTCPMPFFMEADEAARIILVRADRNVGLIAFPWPMRFASWLLSTLPYRLNEALNRLLPKKVI